MFTVTKYTVEKWRGVNPAEELWQSPIKYLEFEENWHDGCSQEGCGGRRLPDEEDQMSEGVGGAVLCVFKNYGSSWMAEGGDFCQWCVGGKRVEMCVGVKRVEQASPR